LKLLRNVIKKELIKKMGSANVFTISKYITLKLENGITNIYIKGVLFRQCKYLLLNVPLYYEQNVEKIDSIDEAAEVLDHSLEHRNAKIDIQPEVEFWGHCSNLQTWVEHNYDTRLLHRNLAFPLLKRLTDIGDVTAKKVFKERIAQRLERKYVPVIEYLIKENYLSYLSKEEIGSLDTSIIKLLEEVENNIRRITKKYQIFLEEQVIPEGNDIETSLERVEWLIEKNRYRQVFRELENLHTRFPDNSVVFLKLGDLYFLFHNNNKSLKYYLKLLRQESENIYALSKVAIICYNLGFVRTSFKLCLRILRINPQFFKILGLIRELALSKHKKAFEYLTSFIHTQIQADRIDLIINFVNQESIAFFTLEELERIFEVVDIKDQELLRNISKLINRKYVIERLRARKRIKISNERIQTSHGDF